jgi:hypothetical protein
VTATDLEVLNLEQALARTGVTYRCLDYWSRRGWINPEGAGLGSGSQRRWPASELEVAALMACYVAAGVTPEAAHHAARHGGWLPGGRYRLAPSAIVPAQREATR